MTGNVTGDGSRQLCEVMLPWLEAKEAALGVLVDDEIEECSYPGYARVPIDLEIVERVPGKFNLIGSIRFPAASSSGGGAFQVVYVIGDDDEITHDFRYEEEKTVPQGGRPRWTVRFYI